MISYRYHLVTVIAIFLAIALGVVIGTSALNGAVVGDLRRQVTDLKSANTLANLHNADLQNQAGNADLMARSFGPQLLAGKLAKTSVVLIGVPGATSAEKDAIAGDVTAAGGTVSGRIQLTQAFIDPSTRPTSARWRPPAPTRSA